MGSEMCIRDSLQHPTIPLLALSKGLRLRRQLFFVNSFDKTNFFFNKKNSTYEKGMLDLVSENEILKAELLYTTNQLKPLKESFNEILETRLLGSSGYSKEFW